MSKRPLPPINVPAVMDRLGACRIAMIELAAGSPPRSLSRAAADQMIRNIDELAWVLAGDRDHFVLKGHGRELYGGPK
ncbi:hypothetical protein RDV64_18845 [Acuticoccus sp. MNP-M23]|uniref:hypothetical protein n=1 Tax=Acuticoccus sp. MNP-M23 TaxID=3072793 RepID=UPI002816381C|nr:hypothetical protein [Acuticoccus sp. MNP-M23]WMS42104.1 hypothetical protein RDV64_18845 [Acuticoccus sp. MNP-M23]